MNSFTQSEAIGTGSFRQCRGVAKTGEHQRDLSMDLLRIAAAMAVILLHTSGGYLDASPVGSLSWMIANVLDSSTRWCVPIFVMISGAFLLQRNIPVKLLYVKYIKHLVVLLLGWNFLYNIPRIHEFPSHLIDVIPYFLCSGGGYHLWFLYMLIGVYVVIPILKKIVDGGLSKYVLILWLLTCVVQAGIPHEILYNNRFFLTAQNVLVFPFSIHYIGFFVLGHYLYREVTFSQKMKSIAYFGGIVGWICVTMGTLLLSRRKGMLVDYFYEYHNIMVVMMAISLFVLCLNTPPRFNKELQQLVFARMIKELSKLTLGVYLIHVFLLGKLYVFALSQGLNSFVYIPIIWILVTFFSFFLSWILNKIPLFNVLVK